MICLRLCPAFRGTRHGKRISIVRQAGKPPTPGHAQLPLLWMTSLTPHDLDPVPHGARRAARMDNRAISFDAHGMPRRAAVPN